MCLEGHKCQLFWCLREAAGDAATNPTLLLLKSFKSLSILSNPSSNDPGQCDIGIDPTPQCKIWHRDPSDAGNFAAGGKFPPDGILPSAAEHAPQHSPSGGAVDLEVFLFYIILSF